MPMRVICAIIIALLCSVVYANQWHDEADRCWNEALKFKKQHNYKQAIEFLKRAVASERKNEHPRSEELIAQLNELGRLSSIIGNVTGSLQYYQLALGVARKYGNPEQEAAAQISIGETCFNLARYEEALDAYSKALAVAENHQYRDRAAQALSNMALAYRVMKDFDRALSYYERARAAAEQAGNEGNIAVITSNIGTLNFFRGEYEEALEQYSIALSIDRKLNNAEAISIDMSNMGGVYAAQGKYGEALNYFEQALAMDRESGNEIRIASGLNRSGGIYYRVGYNERALEFFTRSLEINSKLNNKINAAALENSIGGVYDSMGRYDEAMDHYLKALSLNRNIELNETVLSRLGDIGMIYESRERYDEAVDFLNRSLRRDIQGEKRERIGNSLGNIGRVLMAAKRYDQALEYFRQAAEVHRALGDSVLLADSLKNSGIACYHKKEYGAAVDNLSQALAALDAETENARPAYRGVKNDAFRWLIAAYVKVDKPDLAYEAVEKHSAEKLDCLKGERTRAAAASLLSAEELRKKTGGSCAVVVFANIDWDEPQTIVIDSSSSHAYELDKAAMVNAVYNRCGREIERFMSQKKGDIVFDIQQRSRKDHYFIEFEKIVNYYRSLLGKKYIGKEEYETMTFLGKTFYRFLFNKIENQVAGKAVLIIQPDDSLSMVPFDTLVMDDGRFLAEKYELRYAVSQSAGVMTARRVYPAGRRSLLSVEVTQTGTPPAVHKIESARHFDHLLRVAAKRIESGRDVREVYGYFGVTDFGRSGSDIQELKETAPDAETIAGERTTEKEMALLSGTGKLANYRILHFSGSGIVVPEAPQLGALAVSARKGTGAAGDGLLNVRELSALNLEADLFAVQDMKINPTGFSRGEGIGSLCWSLMSAGARGVSVGLWPVEDRARLLFMKRVYDRVLKKNIPVSTAIAETKRAFIRGLDDAGSGGGRAADRSGQDTFASPYFWGSWIYYGN